MSGCASPTLQTDFVFSDSNSKSQNQSLLIFVRPPQFQTSYAIQSVDLESGTKNPDTYDLSSGGVVATGEKALTAKKEDLSEASQNLLNTSRNFVTQYGVLPIKAGDYAIVAQWGGNYHTKCMADYALIFKAEAGKINVLDFLPSLYIRGLMEETGETPNTSDMVNYISEILEPYENVKGDVQMVKPVAIADFDDPTSSGILTARCASADSFQKFGFADNGTTKSDWE